MHRAFYFITLICCDYILSIPLITQRIYLVCKLAQVLISHTLALLDNRYKPLACCHQTVKYSLLSACHAICSLFLHKLAGAICHLLIRDKVIGITTVRCHCIIAEGLMHVVCKGLCCGLFSMDYKYMLRLVFYCAKPLCKLIFVCMSTDTRQIYYACPYFYFLTKSFTFLAPFKSA